MSKPPGRPITVTLQFDPDEMSRRGRIGASARLAKYDPKSLTENARAAFLGSFEREVDPDYQLADEERKHLATIARSAYFKKLARLSALSRTATKAAGDTATDEEAR